MQTKTIGECPRCERVTFRTVGKCTAATCDYGGGSRSGDGVNLRTVVNCQWKEREHSDECYECEVCGQVVAPMPLGVQPLRACLVANRGE